MLTNQTHSKRLPKPSFKKHKASNVKVTHLDSRERGYIITKLHLDAEDEECVHCLKTTHYADICEMITMVFIMLGPSVMHQPHGYIPYYMLGLSSIVFMMMIPMAISSWCQRRGNDNGKVSS